MDLSKLALREQLNLLIYPGRKIILSTLLNLLTIYGEVHRVSDGKMYTKKINQI